ncbi:MAG: hypothetical protein HXY43_07045 [Fischerella sp.]|uniref:hypothetical protein n=1 Tax=Fischerella sp. TaxID=1191 RepID=UPI0018101391|nr:hypothetical protein [Fischerella sp.]NWF59053.1 hypothetical protein [Fischerella sp.]
MIVVLANIMPFKPRVWSSQYSKYAPILLCSIPPYSGQWIAPHPLSAHPPPPADGFLTTPCEERDRARAPAGIAPSNALS